MDFRVRGSFLLSSLLVLSGAVACGGSGGSDDLFGDGSAGGAAGDGQGGASGASAGGKGGTSGGTGGTSAGAGGTSGGSGGTTAGAGGTSGSGGTGKGGGAGASGAGGSAGATAGSAGAPGGAAGAGGGGASGKGGAGSGGAGGAGTGGAAGKGGTAGGSGTAGAAGTAGSAGTGGATGGAGGSAGAAGGGAAGTAGKGGGAGGQAAVCGDGVKNGTEECDGADLGGKSCTDFAKVGTLACSQCKLDTSGCSSCGNGNIDAGEECDDGNATADDGCTSCKLDGTTCTSAMPIAINDFGSLKLTGSTKGGGSHDNTVCPAKGPDRIYVVTPGKSGFLTAWISRGAFNGASTNFDTVLIAKSDCAGDAVILCNDSFDDTDPGSPKSLPGGEVVSFPVEAGKSYYLIVDGFGASFAGNYDLDLDLSSGQSCADPVPLVIQPGHAQKVIGRTQGQGADSEATCGGKAAADVVYSVTRAAPGTIALSLDATYDSLLYARGTCATNPPELFCAHTPGNGGETGTIGLAPTPSGATFVWVDGLSGAEGEYTLTLDPLSAVSPEGGRPAHAFEATGRLGSNRLSSGVTMGARRSPAARALPHVALAAGVLAASLAACARAPSGAGARAPVPDGRRVVTSNVTRADHAGSTSCQPCHAELYARWEAAAMKRMTRDAAGGAALAFGGRSFRFKDDTVQLEQRDGIRYARITSPKFGSGRYRVTKVIGGRVREDFAGVPVSEDGKPLSAGHDERILPVSYVISTGELRYKGYSVMATERPGMRAAPVWNRTCIFCHNTVPYLSTIYGALAPGSGGYQGTHVDGLLPQARRRPFTVTDEAALRGALEDEVAVIKGSREHAPPSTRKALEWAVSTSRTQLDERHLVEVGIGCEACHMGSKEHVADPTVLPSFAPRSPFLSVTLGPAEAETRACARCHQVLFSQYPFTWEGERRRGGAPGGSNINSGEARDFLLGGCASAMRCSTCHDPHTKQPARSDDAVCVTCHTRYQGDDAVAAHTHHAPKGEGSRCVGCHLPKKNMSLGGGLTRYHRVGSPTDDARVTSDRPLECALCHGDATVESLVSSMERFWGKRYDRQKLAALYGSLDAKPLLATLAMGKPHEQAVAIARLGDERVRAAIPLLAKHMTHPIPLLRYWARDALVKLVGEPSPVNLHQDSEKIAAETRAWLGRHGHAVDVGTQKAGDGKDDDD